MSSIHFTLVEIYEKFAGQYLAEVTFVVIIPEVCNPEKIAQRRQSMKGMQNILSIESYRHNPEKIKIEAFRQYSCSFLLKREQSKRNCSEEGTSAT